MSDDPRQHLTEEQKAALDLGRQIGQHFITDADFAKAFKKLVETAKNTMARDSYHDHMYLVHLRDNQTSKKAIVPVVFADWPPPDNRKYEALQGLGVRIADEYPDHTLVMVAHISEGWGANYKTEDVPDNHTMPEVTPSERPDKVECLIVSLTTQDLRQSCTNWRVYRSSDEKFKHWGKKPLLEVLYDPASYIHPDAEGDFLPRQVIAGYVHARGVQRGTGGIL